MSLSALPERDENIINKSRNQENKIQEKRKYSIEPGDSKDGLKADQNILRACKDKLSNQNKVINFNFYIKASIILKN